MKRVFTFAIVSVLFASVIASCGSSKRGAHCDAYGDATVTVEESDIASR